MKLDKFGFFKSYKAENKERDDIKPRTQVAPQVSQCDDDYDHIRIY